VGTPEIEGKESKSSVKINLHQNSLHPEGFAATFGFDRDTISQIKLCLGYLWNPGRKTWESLGPEVLLDMQRFGLEIGYMSPEARTIAEEFREQLWKSMDIRALPIDEKEMYGYQKYGSQFLATMPNSILADDMGIGKSKQSLDAAMMLEAKNILIICPKTLTYNWLAEIEKWYPDLTAEVVPDHKVDSRKNGPGRKTFWENPPQVVIANYEKLGIDDWPYKLNWDIFIIDEATKCKNSRTQTYKNVKRITKNAKHSWALTGTPLEIRLTELYSILGLLRPAVLGNYMRFVDQHCKLDWAGNVVGAKNLELLRERIGPFMLRRTKAEVLRQLPEKIYQNVYIKLSVPEQTAYAAFTSEFNNWLDEHGVSGSGDPIVQMLRMRQFCQTPKLFTDDLGKGSKFEALEEIISSWPNRVVVFSFFEEVISLLQEWLGCHPEAIISGKVPADERIPRVNAFNAGALGKVMVSTDAGGMGLNITGADLIIHYDQIWNPQKMHQREDRLHRIGQTNNVTVMNMLCMETIDYGMWLVNQERDKLFKDVIDGAEEAMLLKLDAPRLKRLVEGRLDEKASDESRNATGFIRRVHTV
jgi:SNF2 family DNA or RNA helicase